MPDILNPPNANRMSPLMPFCPTFPDRILRPTSMTFWASFFGTEAFETLRCVVGDLDPVVEITRRDEARDRSEDLLLRDGRRAFDVGEEGRLEGVAAIDSAISS
jgi:hypothetical protein